MLHQGGDSGIKLRPVDILSHFLDRGMFGTQQLQLSRLIKLNQLVGRFCLQIFLYQTPAPIKKAIDSTNPAGIPNGIQLVWTNKHLIGSQCIRPVAAINHVKRVYHISFTLTHLEPVRSIDIAIIKKPLDRLAKA